MAYRAMVFPRKMVATPVQHSMPGRVLCAAMLLWLLIATSEAFCPSSRAWSTMRLPSRSLPEIGQPGYPPVFAAGVRPSRMAAMNLGRMERLATAKLEPANLHMLTQAAEEHTTPWITGPGTPLLIGIA